MVAVKPDTAQFRDDLRRLTPQLLNSVLDYTTAPDVDDDVARNKIVAAAQAIIEAARPPQPQWMNQSAACAEFVALRLFIDWGAFEAIPIEGSITYQELADKVDAEVQLVIRFAWIMVSTGLLEQIGEDRVAHTEKSRQITQHGPLRSMWSLMFDNSFMGSASMPEYFRTYGRKEPVGPAHVPFTFAHGAPDKAFWEVLNSDPKRMRTFMEAMTNVDKQVPLMGPHLGLYDFDWVAEAAKKAPSDRPLFVDVGGGKGHVMKTFCDGNTPLTLDRCVLQDLPPIIEHNKSDVNSGLAGAKLMAIDFHKEQPVQGALIYFIRHCLHNYGDESVVGIMKHTAAAMADDSKLLIAEYIMSNPPSKFAIWMDFIMCMSGGKERTKALWHEVTAQAGLKIVAFHGLDTSPDGHAVIECVKAGNPSPSGSDGAVNTA
ncbi:hypothetical protein ACHAQH_009398 [Verticillium albo-atrum]